MSVGETNMAGARCLWQTTYSPHMARIPLSTDAFIQMLSDLVLRLLWSLIQNIMRYLVQAIMSFLSVYCEKGMIQTLLSINRLVIGGSGCLLDDA